MSALLASWWGKDPHARGARVLGICFDHRHFNEMLLRRQCVADRILQQVFKSTAGSIINEMADRILQQAVS